MVRSRFLAVAALAALVPATEAQPRFTTIDVTRPEALERVKRERPHHYPAVVEAMRVAHKVPCPDGEMELLKVRYDLRHVNCGFLLKTSDPPQRHLSFFIEDTRYVAKVFLTDARGRLTPAEHSR